MRLLEIWTDGSTLNNGQENAIGAWGIYIVEDDKVLFGWNGGEYNTTNQRMELTAVLKAFQFYSNYKEDLDIQLNLYTDSAYIYNCWKDKWYEKWVRNGWVNSKLQPVSNKDLWEKIIPYFNDSAINLIKVKGHSTNKGNIEADKLAVEGARRFQAAYENNNN